MDRLLGEKPIHREVLAQQSARNCRLHIPLTWFCIGQFKTIRRKCTVPTTLRLRRFHRDTSVGTGTVPVLYVYPQAVDLLALVNSLRNLPRSAQGNHPASLDPAHIRVSTLLLLGTAILASTFSVSEAADTKQTVGTHSAEATLSDNARFLRSHKTQNVEAAEDEERSANELAAKLDDVLSHVAKVKDMSLSKAMHHLQMTGLPLQKREAIQHFVRLSAADRKIVLDMIVKNNAARRVTQ